MNRQATILALLLAILPACLSAQPATGLPAFGSFNSGTFDTVNNGNLNVYFQIPIVNKAGRGVPFAYTLTYSSSVWSPAGDVWTPVPNWGWTAVTAVPLAGYVSYYAVPVSCLGSNYTMYNGWMYHDPYGVAHSFGGGYVVSSASVPSGCPSTTMLSDLTATDGSGYFMASITGPGTHPSYSGLAAANGAQISAPLPQAQITSGSYTDRNGNIMSAAAAGASFTDTLGDTALTISGSGTPSSPTVLSYTNPSGGTSSYTIHYTAPMVQTAFGCSGINEYGATVQNLISSISLPDGSSYSFTYETTPSHSPNVTGRLATVTLPTGGEFKYSYSGGSNGITCADGTAATLSRTTPDSATAWSYAHSESGCASGSAWCTTISDPTQPTGNETVISFQPDAPSGGLTNGYEVQRKAYQGATTGTLLQTVDTCYNSQAPPCPTVAIGAFPPTQITTRATPGGYTLEAYRTTTYNGYALPLDVYEYDYGNGAQGGLLRKTVVVYDTALTNNIVNMPSSVSVYNGSSTLIAQTKYAYDQTGVTTTSGTPQHTSITGSRGNATTVQYLTSGSTYLTQTYSYYDTGNVNVFADVNDLQVNGGVTTHAETTYTYGDCGNSFATGIAEPQSLSRTYAWNCTGGVTTSLTDENSQIWSANYTGTGPTPITGGPTPPRTRHRQRPAYATGRTARPPAPLIRACSARKAR